MARPCCHALTLQPQAYRKQPPFPSLAVASLVVSAPLAPRLQISGAMVLLDRSRVFIARMILATASVLAEARKTLATDDLEVLANGRRHERSHRREKEGGLLR